MNEKSFYLFVEELYSGKCPYCHRVLPNESFRTKKSCIWCDTEHWRSNEKRQDS